MWGLMKDRKLKLTPAIGLTLVTLALLAGFGFLLLSRYQIEVTVEPEPEVASLPEPTPRSSDDMAQASPIPKPALAAKPDPVALAARIGMLRVSNRTDHPLRVVLLSRGAAPGGTSSKADKPSAYVAPSHWDFAPTEGSMQGLLVSLPGQMLRLRKGDILVAFAQDGSRRYWGPFVVGETTTPRWDGQAGEWQLVIND